MKNSGESNEKYEESRNDTYKEKIIVKNNKDPPDNNFLPINGEYTKPANSNEEEYVRRPMNAFMVWSRSERRKLALKFPNMLNCEISKLLGAEWAKMTETDKKPYILESKKLRTIHSQKYPEYSYRPRRKKRKNESVSVNNQSSVQQVNNGISCYPLPSPDVYDSGFSNSNYNNYTTYYYDQFSNPAYIQSLDPTNISCSTTNFMPSPYNRVDNKVTNYYGQFPAGTQYTNSYIDSYKVVNPYTTSDTSNAMNCTGYYPNYPFNQSSMLNTESDDKNANTTNLRNFGTVYSEISNLPTEATPNDGSLAHQNSSQQQSMFLPTSNVDSSQNQHI